MDILNPSTDKGSFVTQYEVLPTAHLCREVESQLSVQIRLMRAEKEENTLVGTSGWLSTGIAIQELQ
jgi:hypothetical protein